MTTPKEVLAKCRQKDVKAVDLRFTDFSGQLRHYTIPVERLTEEAFEDGFGFDGSSYAGWQSVHESDLVAIPEPATALLDPFAHLSTLTVTCNIHDPVTGERYSRDPRAIANKAVAFLASTGIADTANFGCESKFYIFDQVQFDQSAHEAFYTIDGLTSSDAEGRRRNSRHAGEQSAQRDDAFPDGMRCTRRSATPGCERSATCRIQLPIPASGGCCRFAGYISAHGEMLCPRARQIGNLHAAAGCTVATARVSIHTFRSGSTADQSLLVADTVG